MQPKVSIIVPVYNVEEYLPQCLDSLVNQTLKDIEIICVNDGSTDNSLNILLEYANKDKRITVLKQENQGAAIACNKGMKVATGEYIGFVDPDDWIDVTMYEKMYNQAKDLNSDIVICGYQVYQENKNKFVNKSYFLSCISPLETKTVDVPVNTNIDRTIINNTLLISPCYSYNKIYRRDLLSDYGLSFPEFRCFEDVIFVFQCLVIAEKISYLSEPFYTYRFRAKSTINGLQKQYEIFLKMYSQLVNLIDKIDKNDELSHNLEYFYLMNLEHIYKRNKSHRKTILRDIKYKFPDLYEAFCYKVKKQQNIYHKITNLLTNIREKNYKFEYPIDLVYCWCDGNDPEFRRRKNDALRNNNKDYNIDATSDCRTFQFDELKYSLRSVEKYMPWINHIFIVTDHQVPEWIDLDNNKITIVDQSTLLPETVEYCFNSNAIESVLYKIPGLSEFFIYANDDMFVNHAVSPDFFFDAKGRCIVRGNFKHLDPSKSLYNQQLIYVQNKIKDRFGSDLPINPSHNFDPYLKSEYESCAKCYDKEFNETSHHMFRQFDSVQRLIVHLYSIVRGKAVFFDLKIPWKRHLSALYMSNVRVSHFNDIKTKRPVLFCMNDTSASDSYNRIKAHDFLENLYPYPSQFEKIKNFSYHRKMSLPIAEFINNKSIYNGYKNRTIKLSIFGIPLYHIDNNGKSFRFYFMSLPIYKIVLKDGKRVFRLFNFIPLMKLRYNNESAF